MVTPFDAERRAGRGRAPAARGASGRRWATTAWWSTAPPASRRPPPTPRRSELLRAVVDAVGDRATWSPGRHLRHRAHRPAGPGGREGRRARRCSSSRRTTPAAAGGSARALPAVADATDCRSCCTTSRRASVVAIATDTLLRLAEHPRIAAVKDAKGDLLAGSEVIADTDLAYYSGDDAHDPAAAAVGGVGIVSIIGHVVADRLRRAWSGAYRAGRGRACPRDRTASPLPRRAPSTGSSGVVFARRRCGAPASTSANRAYPYPGRRRPDARNRRRSGRRRPLRCPTELKDPTYLSRPERPERPERPDRPDRRPRRREQPRPSAAPPEEVNRAELPTAPAPRCRGPCAWSRWAASARSAAT